MLEKFHFELKTKYLALAFKVVYVMSLIPLLWIGFYNYPSADDYSIGSNCRQTFVASHSILATVWAGVVRSVEDWIHWMGYFTSNFLMAIPPSTFGERVYVLTAFIMIGMLSLGTIYFLRQLFVKVFHADKYLADCVIYPMLFITIQRMVGRVEAFYWYAGAANYILVHAMCMFFYGLLVSLAFTKNLSKKKSSQNAKIFGTSLLGFLVGGGNQMTALNAAIVLAVVIGFLSFFKKWKEQKNLIAPIACFYIGFLLNVVAPGNWVRAEDASGMNPVKAVLISLHYGLSYCVDQWSGWPVLLLILLLIPIFYKMAGNTKFQFQLPGFVVLFGYGLVSAMMTPPLFAVGSIEAERLQALTYTMYILVLTFCVGYVTGYVRKLIEKQYEGKTGTEKRKQSDIVFGKVTSIYMLTCILFFVFASGLAVIPEPHFFSTSSAITDLANGSAKEYGDLLKRRITIYQSGEENVVVPRLTAEPELLYFSDIKEDPNDWENKGLCRYYGIESVICK